IFLPNVRSFVKHWDGRACIDFARDSDIFLESSFDEFSSGYARCEKGAYVTPGKVPDRDGRGGLRRRYTRKACDNSPGRGEVFDRRPKSSIRPTLTGRDDGHRFSPRRGIFGHGPAVAKTAG